MKEKIIKLLPISSLLTIWLIFSSPFFIKGLVPYPSLYQANFFAPWSAYGIYEGPVKNNAMPDIITQIYPWKEYSISVLKNGQIPLWNPYSFSGTPHLANYQSSPLTPFNLLFFLPISFINSWSILILLQPLLAGLGTYFYLRKSLSSIPSLFGAISFMFCGFLTSWMGYGTLGYAILLLPYALLFVDEFLEKGKFRYLVLITSLIPLSLFSGHFQTSVYFLIALFGYILFFSINKRKQLFLLIFAFLSGLFISMPQVLPSVEFYSNSVRQEIITKLEVIPLNYLPSLLAPDIFGNPVTRNDWIGHYAEWNGFSGTLALVLAVTGVVFSFHSSKKILFFFLLGIFSILLAYDTPLNLLIFNLNLPLFSTSASSRIIVLLSFSVAILSSYGLSYLLTEKVTFKRTVIQILISLFVLTILWSVPLLALSNHLERMIIARNNIIIPSFIIIAFTLSLVLVLLKKHRRTAAVIFGLLALLLVSFDMLRFASKWMPFEPKEYVFKDTGVSNFYKANPTEKRYLGSFTAENSVYYRIQSLGGYDPLYPKRYGEFIKYAQLRQNQSGDRSVVNFPLNSPLTKKTMDFLGAELVSQKKSDDGASWSFDTPDNFPIVYEDEYYRVFRNPDAFKRAYIVYDYEIVKDSGESLDRIFESMDLETKVILEEDPNMEENSNATYSAEITDYTPNKVEISVDSSMPGILVLTDNFYPDWKAYVNGKEEKVYRANYSFRAISIPQGKSIVIFKYEPRSFYNGLYLAGSGIVIIAVLYFFRRKYE